MKSCLVAICAAAVGAVVGFLAAYAFCPEMFDAKIGILVAKTEIGAGAKFSRENLDRRYVPSRFVPADAIDASNQWLIEGLKSSHAVLSNADIRYSDVNLVPGDANSREQRGKGPTTL